MNYGTAIRGHAVFSDEMTGGYFNQKQYIAPIRKGPRILRKKPKVNTDYIMCTLMNEEDNASRINLWPVTRGQNHAVKVNYGTQVLSLTSGAYHNPTIPRKLEDEDYRCINAKYRQEDLVPLSRMPRPVTSIDPNKEAFAFYNKPMSECDIEASRVAHNIRGNLRTLVENISMPSSRTTNIHSNDTYTTSAMALTHDTARDKLASKFGLAENIPKQHTLGINNGASVRVDHVQRKGLVDTLNSTRTVTVNEITDPKHKLMAKLSQGMAAAGRTVNVNDHFEQTKAQANIDLQHKIVGDERGRDSAKLKSIYSETDHMSGPSDTVKFAERPCVPTNINNLYTVGFKADPSLIADHHNVELYKKNAYCEGIDPNRYAGHRERFDRSIPINTGVPYHKSTPFVFAPTNPTMLRPIID